MNLGQLFLAGFDGTTVDENHSIVDDIVRHGLGGVILFDRNVDGSRQNIVSPEQLCKLTKDLQQFGKGSLLIAVDQEGGKVCRLKQGDGFPPTQTAVQLASLSSEETVFEFNLLAETLHDSGINFNLAPVVDLDLNQKNPIIGMFDRSYGADPLVVYELASKFIAAHHARGIACCIKHFPGHGSARADSHQGFVDITDCWQEKELQPYKLLIENGFADGVMTAHVIHGGLDKERVPATLSQQIIQQVLREKLNFDGVVVSDDLQMKAISDHWSFEEAVQRSILAGVDLIIVGNNLIREPDGVARGIKAVAELIDSGRIEESKVLQSLDRVTKLKQKITGVLPWKRNQPTA